MDVIIKSFSRPYYLERCLRTIRQHVHGSYRIIVLDDGTAVQYLDKIRHMFPDITIRLSGAYEKKSKGITRHVSGDAPYTDRTIPAGFWRREISNASDIFLLLEEDAWFTAPVDVASIPNLMRQHELVIVKLSWNSNPLSVKGTKSRIESGLEIIAPQLPVTSPLLMTPFLKNTLKLRSLAFKTGLLSFRNIVPYYALYTVSSAFFRKDYWLAVWKDASEYVDEMQQLLEALKWREHNPASRYGKTTAEKLQTSFITSSTNTLLDSDFDMIKLNHFLNESWLNGKLNVSENLPHDFSVDYLARVLRSAGYPDENVGKWHAWITRFKGGFQSTGASIES